MGTNSRSKRRLGAAVALALAVAGCGDDEGGLPVTKDGGTDSGTSRAGAGGHNAGGRAAEGGRGGMDGGNAGEGSGSGGSSGSTAVNMCDPDVEPETSCGGEDCPGLPAGTAQCTVSCCVDDRCGTRNTGSSARSCEALARETSQCPDYSGFTTNGDKIMLAGCCTQGGQCGVVSQLHRTCIVTSPSVMLPAVPKSCDPNAVEDDAGVDADAGRP